MKSDLVQTGEGAKQKKVTFARSTRATSTNVGRGGQQSEARGPGAG